MDLISRIGAPVEIRLDAGNGKGKGVFATKDIPEGETVFNEVPLVSLQHLDNKASAVVCSRCLRFVGTVETQIGHKLKCLVEKLKGTAEKGEAAAHEEGGAGEAAAGPADGDATRDAEGSDGVDLEEALEAGERLAQIYAEVSNERIAALCEGSELLPMSSDFSLPQPVPCRRGCGDMYCSVACEDEAWRHHHCLLCTASAPASEAAGPSTSYSGASGSGAQAAEEAVEEVLGVRVDRRALAAFAAHAAETNEIFLLAAQVVASTLLKASRLLSEGGGTASDAAAVCGALAAAWRPYVYGWKRCWWEAVAVPEDVEDEDEFRGQLRELAYDSLQLLSAGLADPRFGPEVLRLEVYGSIVGLFELNNLGVAVASPVEDYFLAVDEMEEGPDKEPVAKLTQPLLDALDAEYAASAEATAFLALQSCINHSCDPACTAACDTGDRTATVLAQRDIKAGEEITLSYIDVSLSYRERQAELRDYGFVCRCERCKAEATAPRKKAAPGGKGGMRVGKRR
ncbi:hypothetical protein HYH03_008750 [Edaphochlamys debaryana]|uniref:SET domain-containing protein n=1 Tax=Edaphochlamys debaryana TaxID=47281 RepID=A0A835Y0N4_9CHLO|nr:hypothetical protein HYH03_008750 [Edaphochlamys debaryana]|eukprot:KAG2493087.1 hypothetical protein HYH03_008750 [Edaphochlamys debaryana]